MDFPSYFSSQCSNFHHTNVAHLYCYIQDPDNLFPYSIYLYDICFFNSRLFQSPIFTCIYLRVSVFASIKDQFTVHYSKGSVKHCNSISSSLPVCYQVAGPPAWLPIVIQCVLFPLLFLAFRLSLPSRSWTETQTQREEID